MILITCSPGPSYFNPLNPSTHNISGHADAQRSLNQHSMLVRLIRESGVEVINLPELPGHPNSVFTKDSSVCTPQGYIRVRMGLPSRAGEEQWIAETLMQLGLQCIGEIDEPGTVEGGDVILSGHIAFIGNSGRTNKSGTRQVSAILGKCGYKVRVIRVPRPFLHLGGAMTLVSPDTILCVGGLLPYSFTEGFHLLEIPNNGFISGNVIPLPNRQVIADRSNSPAIEVLQKHNFSVLPLDLSEFIKGNGGPSCLIMQVAL